MLPDFPKLKKVAEDHMALLLSRKIPRLKPLLGFIGRFDIHEGRRWGLEREGGSVDESDLEKHSVSLNVAREDLRRFNPKRLLEA